MPKSVTGKFDFSGYATRNNLKCTDGRTIMPDAFKENDGATVPLVWHHMHDEPTNVLGHALLENRPDGVYCYGFFNNTPNGQNAKMLVHGGDIQFLSIYANDLIEKSKNVVHGMIREVSLVLAGANPGAVIDNLVISHGDGSETPLEDEALIQFIDPSAKLEEAKTEEPVVEHADSSPATNSSDETLADVLDTFSEKQKLVLYALIAQAMDSAPSASASHSDIENSEGDSEIMKKNVFDQDATADKTNRPVLTHADFSAIVDKAKTSGQTFKKAFIEHVSGTYGIDNIDWLFPDATELNTPPEFWKRDTGWVGQVMGAVNRRPFSRIKTTFGDISPDEARARGYVKGNLKKEEVFGLIHRTTTPTTVYKKQKLDRDDVVDITDFDVVMWLKGEMRLMLDEELARSFLVGDGRDVTLDNGSANPDKIDETHIRPVWTDDDMYAHHVEIAAAHDSNDIIDDIARARSSYKGSGNPVLYTTSTILSDMLLLKDDLGRRIYESQGALEAALRVSAIVEVPVMENLTREVGEGPTARTLKLIGIAVNLRDYSVGADKGGQINSFEDFDIDYNQMKYLMETRCSGALSALKSALVFEQVVVEDERQ